MQSQRQVFQSLVQNTIQQHIGLKIFRIPSCSYRSFSKNLNFCYFSFTNDSAHIYKTNGIYLPTSRCSFVRQLSKRRNKQHQKSRSSPLSYTDELVSSNYIFNDNVETNEVTPESITLTTTDKINKLQKLRYKSKKQVKVLIQEITKRWIENVVIKLRLFPFLETPLLHQETIGISVDMTSKEEMNDVGDFMLQEMIKIMTSNKATGAFLIFPYTTQEILVQIVDLFHVQQKRMDNELFSSFHVILFHPHFDKYQKDDHEENKNFSFKSPFPMLFISQHHHHQGEHGDEKLFFADHERNVKVWKYLRQHPSIDIDLLLSGEDLKKSTDRIVLDIVKKIPPSFKD